jgi:Spy/CpxP family protein refolding chaperone
MFLLGALLAGGVLGFTADRVLNGAHDKAPDIRTLRASFARRLDLTAAQKAVVDSILDDRNRQMMELLMPQRPAMDSIRARARAQIRRILTPAQQVEYEAVIREQQADTTKGKE